jgi:hypothetical protein
MLKTYCTECGSPTTYTSAKPKFCSACGTPFDKLVVNKVLLQKPTADKPVTQNRPQKRILPRIERKAEVENYDDNDDDYDDYDNVNTMPEINDLDIEIQETPRQKIKIGDIVGSAKNGSKREKIQTKKLTKNQMAEERKKFLENFKKEAGSIRGKSRGPKDG